MKENQKDIKLILGDCIKVLKELPKKSIDLIFADPPYNLSGKSNITVKSGKRVICDKGEWDKIENYTSFTYKWIKQCRRVLTDDGTIWISGTLHSHPTIGFVLKKLDFWIINDVIWYKPNAPPLLSANRLAPSTELIWLASKDKKYYFNYKMGKTLNDGKQMRNLWTIPAQRHKTDHPVEKPEPLLKRIILLGSKQGDRVLDPFFGSGTTGVVAKRLGRKFTGIEIEEEYYKMGEKRIESTKRKETIPTVKKIKQEKLKDNTNNLVESNE